MTYPKDSKDVCESDICYTVVDSRRQCGDQNPNQTKC